MPDMLFIGEGPGADEDQFGEPFSGPAGQLLDKMIAGIGYSRSDVYIDNIVKCRPPNNRKPKRDEAETCSNHIKQQIEIIQPFTIICVGGVAAEYLLGLKAPMYSIRGKWYQYKGIPCRVIYHPAYLLRLRDTELLDRKQETWTDLQAIRKLINEIKSGESWQQ